LIALPVIVILISVTIWLMRRSSANRSGPGEREGQRRRLAVIHAARIDKNRMVVLVRRDNIEHLLMIGGPNDVVIEANIVRVTGAQERVRRAAPVRGPVAEFSNNEVTLSATPSLWPVEQTPISSSQLGRLSELAHQLNDGLHRPSAAMVQSPEPLTKAQPAEPTFNLEDDLAMLVGRRRPSAG
jgi:hypothetical protein